MRTDGTVYQAAWRLIDDGKTILITGNDDVDAPDEGFQIKSISNSNLELYSREDDGSDYYESTIYLTK
ncbi:MAG: hypothetical protein EOO02_05535 [Chitinophagaceae bacterium]|nr:MAG: hypothetical protein EOO02_05535 [Chitinophagaceae bacterium]